MRSRVWCAIMSGNPDFSPLPFYRLPPFLQGLQINGENGRKRSVTVELDRGREPVRHFRGVTRSNRQEGAEVEMAAASREVAEAAHVDEGDILAPAARHLGDRAAFHLYRLGRKLAVQSLPLLLGVDEAVAGQDRAEMDRGRARSHAHISRQWRELEARDSPAQPRDERLVFGISGPPVVAAARRPTAGLDGKEVAFAVRSVVVLDMAGPDHDVSDAEGGVEPAGDAAQHQ